MAEVTAAAITKMVYNIPKSVIVEITNPAVAKPFGFFFIPIIEKINPKITRIQFIIGNQNKKIARIDKTKPAIPILFF